MIKMFRQLKKREWLLFLCSVLFIIAQVWLDLKLPDYMSKITQLVQTEGSEMEEILAAGGKMLLCAFFSLATSFIVAAISAKIAANLSGRLRFALFNRVQSFSMEEINHFSTASLVTRSTNDVTQVQMFVVMGLQILIKAPILAGWALVKITNKGWQWTLATAVAVAVLIVIVSICVWLGMPKFKGIQRLTDNVNKIAREHINGLRVIRAYNAEGYQEEKFERANTELTYNNLFVGRVMAFLFPSINLIMSGLTLAIYWIGAFLIDGAIGMERMTVFSDMIVFSSYAMQVVMAFMMLIMIMFILPRATVSASRINEVLEMKPTIEDGNFIPKDERLMGEIEFKDVCFRYADGEDYVLDNINFKVSQGETVALIGATGCGKSTLVNLIPRFYDVTEGEILIGGVNIKDYDQQALRNELGYVSQRAILFEGTIQSNVAFGDNGKASSQDETVEEAIEIAQASEFVNKMEERYEAHVAQGGTNLSGGQKQRLSIARAVARRPKVLIFDDSFSALDYKTDRTLRQRLKKETAGATLFIVAQRIGTIKDADKIIVLDEGRIVGMGSHDSLMASCEVYREIAYSQLSKEELES
ncbi:multidrug ABC transporter ATP-binding protein [Turicibacter faecis]|uniref:Multidrug ABC transporter ATP-binding protein n=1 Tax=Turicibacter faecis TaxID=2963365 RepID=A0ABN6ZII7_9FIRM|nr:ABC transporter ATP-binding protein [Turicibacter sp. TS3]NCE78596.1 ABC transporter ATP-binding protein [Turicibacter sp. TS3]BEH90753.1 multidrug ABC transporter ATP-binding protein [Turicibacter sp. TC023]